MGLLDQLSVSGGISERSRSQEGDRQFLMTGVVVEFISNPVEQRDSIVDVAGVITNKHYINRMPRNSIVARIIGNDAQPMICYPFFSPHFCLPVKPGEQVWVLFPDGRESSLGYWMTRKATDIAVDDLNYTHLDRVSKYGAESPESGQVFNPANFPKGQDDNPEHNTLPGSDPYESIVSKSLSYNSQFSGESVPRFSKRCGDLTVQGSNNTLISLGEDRNAGSFNTSSDLQRGSIDIVAGRGATTSTAPAAAVSNTRGYDEVDKAPTLTGNATDDSIFEGDPDFVNDLSRIYVSMKTSGDENFETSPTGIGANVDSVDDSPYIIIKSENPRIISDSSGNIRIIHKAGSSIVMDASGNVQIQCGNEIAIGKDGSSGLQPFVKGNDMVSIFNSLVTMISTMASMLSSGGTTPGFGGPNPILAIAMTTLQEQLNSLDMGSSLSGIIKGE